MSMIMILESLPSDTPIAAAASSEASQLGQIGEPAVSGLQIFDESDEYSTDDFSDDFDDDVEFGENSISLEKAWHGLHFLLTGDAWGGTGWRAFLVTGGAEQGEDFGYGPARYFSPSEVREVAREIGLISPDDLWANYDAQAMNSADIYPTIWDEEEDDLKEEYLDYFEELKSFIAQTAEAGDALRICLT